MQPLTFINMGRDAATLNELRTALVSTNRAKVLGECTNHDDLLAEVIRLHPSATIVVLENEDSDNNFSLIKKIGALSPSTAIIAAARAASPSLIMGSMRAGAREFLEIPINTVELNTVVNRIAELRKEDTSAHHGRVVAVFSGKGGTGISFFATNLAA